MPWLNRTKGYKPPPRWLEKLRGVMRLQVGMLIEYDPEWDHWLRVAITLGMVKPSYYGGAVVDEYKWLSEYTVQVGPYTVWVGNYPYAFGHKEGEGPKRRPSFATMKLLHDEVQRIRKELLEDYNAQLR